MLMCLRWPPADLHSRLEQQGAATAGRTAASLASAVAGFGDLVRTAPTDQAVCQLHELPVPGHATFALVDDARDDGQVAVLTTLFQIAQRTSRN